MPLHTPYDPDNVFAKMLRGEVPAVKVFEDDFALAFMDIFPQVEGHTLVIPKGVEACNILDMPTEKIGAYMERVQRIARAIETALSPEGIVITQFNGAAAGQTVFHLHFHILPKYKGQSPKAHGSGAMVDAEALEPIAAQIRAAL
ncbi:MAG: HIT family protein [Pseudomonadota bacterium]